MRKILCVVLLLGLLSVSGFAQITKSPDKFTEVTSFEDKVVFLKEFDVKDLNPDSVYAGIKDWGRKEYGKDTFVSSIKYDPKNKEVRITSRIELLLPEDSEGKRESVPMKYRLNVFLCQDKCVMEVKGITFHVPLPKDKAAVKTVHKSYRAEELILPSLKTLPAGISGEFRNNLEKSTIFFLNTLLDDVSVAINRR